MSGIVHGLIAGRSQCWVDKVAVGTVVMWRQFPTKWAKNSLFLLKGGTCMKGF